MVYRNKRTKHFRPSYENLESRNLLATMVFGTPGDDLITVTYVDETTVDIQNNDTTMPGVDITDGLLINLLGGSGDKTIVDHRITGDVTVVHSEQIELTGGDNDLQISGMQDPSNSLSNVVVGSANGNVRFAWLDEIQTGNGMDVFTVNSELDYDLEIFGGEGDDTFRFMSPPLESETALSDGYFQVLKVTGNGQGGNDRFNFFGGVDDQAIGGDGFDTVDYRNSNYVRNVFMSQLADGGFQNERVFANPELENTATFLLQGDIDYDLNWYVVGDWMVVQQIETGVTIEMMSFTDFKADTSTNVQDSVYILSTGRDIGIHDFERIAIGSTIAPEFATLETIKHNLGVHRTTRFYHTGDSEAQLVAPAAVLGTDTPEISINNKAGDGSIIWANLDGSLQGIGQGSLHFGQVEFDEFFESFQPQIKINGSDIASDTFVINRAWTPIEILGNGGDDTIMIGGVNGQDGSLDEIRDFILATGGEGTDRIYFNDQNNEEQSTHYIISDELVKDHLDRFKDITLLDRVEVVRVNGSNTLKNTFTVTPSNETKLVVDGSGIAATSDSLRIRTPGEDSGVSEIDGTGSWFFGDDRQNVFFYGIEDTNNPLNSGEELIVPVELRTRSHVYSMLSDTVISSQAEMDQYISDLDSQRRTSGALEFADELRELTIDFSKENFLLYTHTETSGSIRVKLDEPLIEGDTGLISIERTIPQLGTADMADYGYGYSVDKSISEITFDLGYKQVVIENT